MSFLQYNGPNGLRPIFTLQGYPAIPNVQPVEAMANWQFVPLVFEDIVTNFLGLYRLPSPPDKQRPFIITRIPHLPPRQSELVIRIQGKVVGVDLGPLGNWNRRTDMASCAKAVKSITLGCHDSNVQGWLDTISAVNQVRQGVRHLVCQTPRVAANAAITTLPVEEDTVLKFEHRVFQRHGTFRQVPDLLDANHLLEEVSPGWTISDTLPVFRSTPGNGALAVLDPTLIKVGDFVDVSASISVSLNRYRSFYLSYSLLRVIQLTPAPILVPEDLVAANAEDNDDGGPVLDFIPETAAFPAEDAEMGAPLPPAAPAAATGTAVATPPSPLAPVHMGAALSFA